jgi:hypothetical protein
MLFCSTNSFGSFWDAYRGQSPRKACQRDLASRKERRKHDLTRLTFSTKSPAISLTMSQKSFSWISSFGGVQKDTSLKHGGNFEYGLNVVISFVANCERNRESLDQNRRMSGMEKRTMAMRSRPRPKAHPILLSTSVRNVKKVGWQTRRESRTSVIQGSLFDHPATQDF